jgi:hypothetical protein
MQPLCCFAQRRRLAAAAPPEALGGQGAQARAAVMTADVGANRALGGATGGQGTPTPVATVSHTERRLRVAQAERATSSMAPPEYHGQGAQHVADNKAEFEKRKRCVACFACLNTRVQYCTFHLRADTC